eukprot:GFUD01032499.1.p1 GENE.GFUD01032499.1~~GFUD01032499.1.p1  ORF type:complete len:188 (+),score=31.63 GFUD01032499.1:20-583(+)
MSPPSYQHGKCSPEYADQNQWPGAGVGQDHSAQFSPLGKEDSVLLSGGHSINLGVRPENVLLPGGHKYFKKWLPTSPFFERGKIGKLPQKWKSVEKIMKMSSYQEDTNILKSGCPLVPFLKNSDTEIYLNFFLIFMMVCSCNENRETSDYFCPFLGQKWPFLTQKLSFFAKIAIFQKGGQKEDNWSN